MINTQLGSNTTLSAIRRQTGAGSLLAFMKMYLHHRVPLPWSRMHKEMAADFDQIGSGDPLHLALAAPDGYGKTTIATYGLVLWALAYKKCRCIVIGSHTRAAAGELLRGVNHELRTNTVLHTDFPHLASVQRGSGSGDSRISSHRNMYIKGVARLTTSGTLLRLGEIDFEGSPPDLVILDGFEASRINNEQSKWREKSVQLQDQMRHQIPSMLPNASLIVIDTLLNGFCMIDRLLYHTKNFDRGWSRRFYSAVEMYPVGFDLWFKWANLREKDLTQAQEFLDQNRDQLLEGARVLWPEHESFEELMILRARQGWEWFDRYRQGCPLEGSIRKNNFNPMYDRSNMFDDPVYATDTAGYRRYLNQRSRVDLMPEGEVPPDERPLPDGSEWSYF